MRQGPAGGGLGTRRLHRRSRLAALWLGAVLAALLLFRGWPGLDLAVTAAIHAPGATLPFVWSEAAWVQASYQSVPWVGRLGFLACLLVCAWPRRRVPCGERLRWRRRALALMLVLLFGLWGLVNAGLKEWVGRPRPHSVAAFGGPLPYQPVGTVSALCRHNCSFVSGHAATGYALMACGLIGGTATRRRWAWAGAVAGTLVGAGRVLQGDHFLSDIVFAGLAIGGVCLAVRALWLRRRWWRLQRLQRLQRRGWPAASGERSAPAGLSLPA